MGLGNTCCLASAHESHCFWEATVGHFLLGAPSCSLYTILFLHPCLFRMLLGFHVWFPFQAVGLLTSECVLVGIGLWQWSLAVVTVPRTVFLPALVSPGVLLRQASGAANAAQSLETQQPPPHNFMGPIHKGQTVNGDPLQLCNTVASWRTRSSWVLYFMSIPPTSCTL